MKRLPKLALLFTVFSQLAWSAPDPKQIMQKNEDVRKIIDLTSSATLKTGGGARTPTSKSFKWWRKLGEDGVHFKTLTKFSAPAEVRDEAILFLEQPDDQSEVLMYLPSFKKVRRVESNKQSGSFMSSDFTYADIAAPHIQDFSYKYLKEEKCPGVTPAADCHVIQADPARDSVKERTGNSKSVSWIRKDNSMAVQVEYYGLDGSLAKRLKASDIRQVDAKRGNWFAHSLRMENVKNQQFTDLKFETVKVNTGIDDAIYSKQNLGRSD